MFDNITKPTDWNIIFSTLDWLNPRREFKLKLLDFNAGREPIWEEYLKDQRKNYGADLPDQKRFRHFFGDVDTEQHFLQEIQKRFIKYAEYCKHWKGLCRLGEVVEVIRYKENFEIVLTKNWTGTLQDHVELLVELHEEKTFLRKHIRYFCDIWSTGTIGTGQGPIHPLDKLMGVEPGFQQKIWNRQGLGVRISFDKRTVIFCLDDAKFKVI